MADFDFKSATPVTTGVTSSYYLFGAASQGASTPEIYSVGAAVGSSTATFTNKTFDTAGTGNSFSINGLAATANTGTGAVARAAGPTFTTPTLGVATATSLNGLTVTSSTGTFTLTNSKTLSVSNTLTFTGTDGSSVAFGTGGTVLYSASTIPLTVGSTTIASGTTTRILYDNAGVLGEYTITGSGTVVAMATSPSFTTPTLGVATATSVNGLTITSSTGTLTISNGKTLTSSVTMTLQGGDASVLSIAAAKTLTCSNTLTFTGTDTSSVAFGAGGTVLYTASTIPLTVGGTTIASGTNTRILYDNSGVLGEYTLTGTGTVVAMQTAPTFATSITTPSVLATANDSGALGASGTAFSDLFLASGALINFSAGNSVITHSSAVLTVSTGDLRVTTAGTDTASVATLGGTQELDNKTLDSSVGKGTWTASGTWTLPAITLGGTVSGGGNQLNNIIIGTSTPLAGTFTTVIGNSFVPNSSNVPSDGLYLPAANTLGWAINSAAEMQLTSTALSPAADGGSSLGTTALGWQNLFGNTGFVVNIENGNWVATHTTDILTVGTGDLRVTTAGTNTASVVTVGGTQTLAAKTLTAPRFASGGFIADANGNELLIFTTTASAVNELTFANGSTGVNPKWTASGETNVGMDFQAKGTGTYRLLGTAEQAAELRLYEDTSDGTNYTAFKAGTQAGDITYTLPVDDGDSGEVLSTNGDGVLSWVAGGGVPTTITVANEATDTSCFLAFFTAATGDLGPKTNANLPFNSNTGVLTLTAPVLGTPTSGTLTNCTGLPSIVAANEATDTSCFFTFFTAATGELGPKTNANLAFNSNTGLVTFGGALTLGTSNAFTCGTIELGAASDTTISRSAAGVIAVEGVPLYSNIPQNSQSAAYTTVLGDAQKHILHPTADNNARTFTIDSNANVAYPLGTAITFINEINTVTIAITSDTLVLAGAGTTGSRTLAAMGIATAIKKTSTSWIISGTGLT